MVLTGSGKYSKLTGLIFFLCESDCNEAEFETGFYRKFFKED
jgi:hypothetical protein